MSIYFIPIVTLLGAALFRCRSIRALCRPISPCGLNTGFWLRLLPVGQYAFAVARGCATLTPGCILAPHQGALFPLSQTSHLPQADVNSPAPILTSAAGRCQFPRPKPHICRRQMSIPPLQTSHLPQADVNSPSQFMERGSGGEVNNWG